MQEVILRIAQTINIGATQVSSTVNLLNEGATVPFIARYRKEKTGGLNEVQIINIEQELQKLNDLQNRKNTVINTIQEQGNLKDSLLDRINNCWDANELEDIYMPYKPKRKTKASVAKEKGLEPLAKIIMTQGEKDLHFVAQRFVKGELQDEEEALSGARDIIAEWVSEREKARAIVRRQFEYKAMIKSRVIKTKIEEASKYRDYFEWEEPLKRCPSHRLLAMRRGEKEGFLRVSINVDEQDCIEKLEKVFVCSKGECAQQIILSIKDSFKRLLAPSIETEFAKLSKLKADQDAIAVFAENLKQLLLAPPLGEKRVLAIDPGFRTGCKLVGIDKQANLLFNTTIYPHPPQSKFKEAEEQLKHLVHSYNIEAIAVGNGTAGRETEQLLQALHFGKQIDIFMVSEDGASIYSASEVAREEFPKLDVTVRGAISIGRRLIDPLAELVKIDAKSIGVGQYQHDVDQKLLKESLDRVVVSAVNLVGVNVNTASKHLLSYISGLGKQLAQNIVDYRTEKGAFSSREELKKVPRMGAKAFEQCAGFLRIDRGNNPLDNSAVHPESYSIVKQMTKDLACDLNNIMSNNALLSAINASSYVNDNVGEMDIKEIIKELMKPSRDPRNTIKAFSFADVYTIKDLHEGMQLPGIVTNLTKFGAFVDVGIKQDGLVHISQITDSFISNPAEVLKIQQRVQVQVVDVDESRNRISLSMRGVTQPQ